MVVDGGNNSGDSTEQLLSPMRRMKFLVARSREQKHSIFDYVCVLNVWRESV